jgi:hypothetical protein
MNPEILVDPQTHTVYIRWPGAGLYTSYLAGFPGDLPAPAPGCIAYVPAEPAPAPAPATRPARRPVVTAALPPDGRGWRSA